MKRRFRSINHIAAWYAAASIFIGPGLIFLIAAFSPGPIGDCGDSSWYEEGRTHADVARIARHYDLLVQIGEGVMLVIGAVILGLLISRGRRTPIVLFLAVPFVMACYALTIWVLSGPACGGGV